MGDALATKAKGMWKRFGLLTQSLGMDDMLSADMPFSEVDLQIVVEAFKFPVDAADVMPDMDDADAMLTWLTKAPRGQAIVNILGPVLSSEDNVGGFDSPENVMCTRHTPHTAPSLRPQTRRHPDMN